MNTHFIIAKSIIENIDSNKFFFLDKNNFIYGNLKPDLVPKYLLKKHYLDESLDMIISKVKYLCNLSLDNLSKYFSICKFSQELGVICHFLCDFFCVAHSERWEMKHSMIKHVIYEKKLNYLAKNLDLCEFRKDYLVIDNFEDFFHKIYDEYKNKLNHKNDLLFSTYVCNCIVEYILSSILKNTATAHTSIKYAQY